MSRAIAFNPAVLLHAGFRRDPENENEFVCGVLRLAFDAGEIVLRHRSDGWCVRLRATAPQDVILATLRAACAHAQPTYSADGKPIDLADYLDSSPTTEDEFRDIMTLYPGEQCSTSTAVIRRER